MCCLVITTLTLATFFEQGIVKIFYDAKNTKIAAFSEGVVDGRPFKGGMVQDFEAVSIQLQGIPSSVFNGTLRRVLKFKSQQ